MFQVLATDIEKSLVDDRQYKFIRLENDLNVLLIHDPKADKSAAGLDVFVGSCKDNEFKVPGLAHFCEHLLFMGTKKYPSENEYASYLSEHGGHSNAFTSFEHTNYYFEVNSEYLKGALDRFAQFFIEPLFDESCKDREINAVDSENKKNLRNDLWRFHQLERLTSNPKHPYNHFSTGNIITLGEEPVSKGINVREVLLNFHDKNYSSNLMNLVILGKESLDELSEYAVEMFSSIQNKKLPPPSYQDETIYTLQQLQKYLKVLPIKDSNKLDLTFMIPDDQDSNWHSLPANYYSHLVGHESKGSIYYLLNELGWISDLSCGSYKVCTGSSLFLINCELTPEGLDHYEDIIVHIFEYLKLVTSLPPQEWLVDEIRMASEINFKFKQKQNAAQTVSRLSNSLYKFSDNIPADLLFSYASKIKFDPEAIIQYGKYLSLDNMRYSISSKSFDELPETEHYYGTNYRISDIDSSLVKRIKGCQLNDKFKLPLKNEFIPENFEIYNKNIPVEQPLSTPYLLKDESKFQVWFKQDDQFNVPKLIINLFLHLPNSNEDIGSSIMTQLFCELLDDELNDLSYYASIAGLSFSVNQWRDGILIKLNGYNDKIFKLLKEILTKVIDFTPKQNKFDVIKFDMLQDFKNSGFEVPYLQINNNFLTMLNEKTYLTTDKVPVLEKIQFSDILKFIKEKLFTNIFAESLLTGNVNLVQLNKFFDMLTKTFKDIPRIEGSPAEVTRSIRLQSHVADETVQIDSQLEDPDNVNSCIDYFIKIGGLVNYQTRSLAELISTIFHEPCFNQLRTKEQLGYVVFSGIRTLRTYLGYRVLIQSEKPASYLRSRIETFLSGMRSKLEEMSTEDFENYKKTLIDKKLVKLKNLEEESNRFWNSITDGYYDFTCKDKLVEQIKLLTKDQLLEFYDKFINPESQSPRFILNLGSQKSKFVALKKIIGENDTDTDKLIEEYKDDIKELVNKVAEKKQKSEEYKKDLLEEISIKLKEWFPQYDDKKLQFYDFRNFKKAGIPEPVEPLTNFHYTELHL